MLLYLLITLGSEHDRRKQPSLLNYETTFAYKAGFIVVDTDVIQACSPAWVGANLHLLIPRRNTSNLLPNDLPAGIGDLNMIITGIFQLQRHLERLAPLNGVGI
ncbi:MAG TPA: hypothetical protein PKC51_01875, partial [Ferruginibacter sp.]|nr:hypothetical protein [Ferruginibacter sp.]